ncbi:MAG: NAD(P)/FAD-dependent oxidoreductase [Bacillota bacterium]|nr:NAD(P)/FAD-dependent oxidoreductase [Bacillota bacterium]
MEQRQNKKIDCAIAIVGGGAAGMVAAIMAAHLLRQPAGVRDWSLAPVVLLERQDRIGKKLLATGNGRCNLSHQPLDYTPYHGNDPTFIDPTLSRYDVDATLDWFAGIGLYHRTDPDGRVFPYSYQASAVLDLLRREAERLPISVQTNCRVISMRISRPDCFILTTSDGQKIAASRVIIATGGMAAPAFGCEGDGYALLAGLGHRLIEPHPALVQICTAKEAVRGFSGIRIDGRVSLTCRGKILRQEDGEILFTDYGLSGPPILQLSRAVHHALLPDQPDALRLQIDFLPGLTADNLKVWLIRRRDMDPQLPLQQFLTGLLHKKIGLSLVKQACRLPLTEPVSRLQDSAILELIDLIKNWQVTVTGTRNWTQAQVTAGGIATGDFDPRTLMSQKAPGLFAAGEVLDVDGDCGGYNLQWAWSSGLLAGEQAARSWIDAYVQK